MKRLLGALAFSGLLACGKGPDEDPTARAAAQSVPVTPASGREETDIEINPRLLRRFQPLPDAVAPRADEPGRALVDLGRQLFYDPRLSKNENVSCNACHKLDSFGVDGRATSAGTDGVHGGRNSPSVYNVSGHFAQFWDGRAIDVEEQARGPIVNPIEMGMTNAPAVVQRLTRVRGYERAFRDAFPGDPRPVTLEHVGVAIGAFERGLVTPGRWDAFLRGDANALTRAEKKGLKAFLDTGCMVCHTGPYVGGSMFERLGAVVPWPNQSDQGRYDVTHLAADKMMFKVPSLRNVEKTAPYFHDGSAATLEEAVREMGKHQLGIDLTSAEVDSIATWLKALTGAIPADYVAPPEPLR